MNDSSESEMQQQDVEMKTERNVYFNEDDNKHALVLHGVKDNQVPKNNVNENAKLD